MLACRREIMSSARTIKTKEVGITIDFGVFKLQTKWVSDPRQREAAWALYVELATRIATQPLDLDEGALHEALASLHDLFPAARNVLRKSGPAAGAGPDTVGGIALAVLNGAVRPFLARWHTRLDAWEDKRPEGRSAHDHERAWELEAKCRGELEKLRQGLVTYAQTLATISTP
jgi:hypothetical protein